MYPISLSPSPYPLRRVLYVLLLCVFVTMPTVWPLSFLFGQSPTTVTETGWPRHIESLGLLTVLSGISWLLYRRDERKDKRIEEMQSESTERLVGRALSLEAIIQKQDATMDQLVSQVIQQQAMFGKSLEQFAIAMEKIVETLGTVKMDHSRMLADHEENKKKLDDVNKEITAYLLKDTTTPSGSKR